MAHPVLDGNVSILKVVSPGCYWIKCGNCQGSCWIPESICHKPYSGDYYPSQGAQVFVRDSDGFFYHGTVCGKREVLVNHKLRVRKYVVQLTHALQVKDFDRIDVYPSFGECNAACKSGHLVSLYNVLPSVPSHTYRDGSKESHRREEMFERDIRDWYKCNNVVQQLLELTKEFQFEQISVINGLVYGNLYFSTRELVKEDIKTFLISKKIGVNIPIHFAKCVNYLMLHSQLVSEKLLPIFVPVNSSIQEIQPSDNRPGSSSFLNSNFTGFTVYEGDRKLHESLFKEDSVNILYTKAPGKNDVPIKFVAPDGTHVLGTVFTPKIYKFVETETIFERDRCAEMLDAFFLRQEFPEVHNHCAHRVEKRYSPISPSTSSEGSKSEFSHDQKNGLLTYDFDNSYTKFTDQGTILEHVTSEKPFSDPTLSPVLRSMEIMFDLTDVSELQEWQKVCLPSILDKKSMFIIGPESIGKVTTSVVCVLSSLENSNTKVALNCTSPSFLVLVSNYERAERIARLCAKLSYLKMIVSSSSQITDTQKEEAMEGCDILITTVGNWTHFSREIKCFNYTRLAYVVFDCFERLHEHEQAELEYVFNRIACQSKNSDIQMFILSNAMGPFLVSYFKTVGKPTLCVTDIVHASFGFRLKPKVVLVSEDWLEQLELIIKTINTTKRLLLCNDHHEVTAIHERLNISVLSAHENESREKILETINRWNSNENTFLICSDILFRKLDFTKKSNLLVCWKLNSCDRAVLVQRFMAIRGHALGERAMIPVYIFCSRHNLEELVFMKNILSNVQHCQYLGGDIDECVRISFKMREQTKESKHCPQLCMFGKCYQSPLCPYRHHFRRTDALYTVANNVYLKISLVKLHNPLHFTVRVLEITSNQQQFDAAIDKFRSSSSIIEQGLKEGFHNHEVKGQKSTVILRIGKVVGARFSEGNRDIFRRVKISSVRCGEKGHIEQTECEVEMIDYCEPKRIVRFSDLFNISNYVKILPSDLVDIFISKLVPSDFKSDWIYDTNCYLNNFAELAKRSKSLFSEMLAGPIEAVVGQSIIVDSIYWYEVTESTNVIVDASFKELILHSKFGVNNPEHIHRLSEVAVESDRQPLLKNLVHMFGFRQNFPSGNNLAFVTAFDNPGLFYVQLESERDKLEDFEDRLTAVMMKKKRPLSVIVLGELCAVCNDDIWNRAVIFRICNEDDKIDEESLNESNPCHSLVTILFVDYGDMRTLYATELFCLPDEFLLTPYFSLECELVSIAPTSDKWSDEAFEEFRSHIRTSDDEMKTLEVKFLGVCNVNSKVKYFRHQVALLDPENVEGVTINQCLVREGVARWNEETIDLLLPRKRKSNVPPHRSTTIRK